MKSTFAKNQPFIVEANISYSTDHLYSGMKSMVLIILCQMNVKKLEIQQLSNKCFSI